MLITRVSMLSGTISTLDLDVTSEQLESHRNGELAQNAFPQLTPPEREFLISGVTPAEWAREFAVDEDE